MDAQTSGRLRGCALGMMLGLGAGCGFNLSEHPASCAKSADCETGHECYKSLCVAQYVPGEGGGTGGSGSTSDAARPGDSGTGGSVATLGDGGGPIDDGGPMADAGGGMNGVPDSGQPAKVEAYATCAQDAECNAGEVCRTNGNRGACSAPCVDTADCPTPLGNYDASPTCDANECRLNCAATGVPPFPRSCPGGMTCVTELAKFTCYPQ